MSDRFASGWLRPVYSFSRRNDPSFGNNASMSIALTDIERSVAEYLDRRA